MPALALMVLDALAAAAETIYSMRNCGDMAANGLALVGDAHLLDALRSLLANGLVDVEAEHVSVRGGNSERPMIGRPSTTDSDLQRYWFRMTMTPAGLKTWEAATAYLTRTGHTSVGAAYQQRWRLADVDGRPRLP